MDRNLISQRLIDALELEALRAYFDSRRGEGRPTAESVTDKLGTPVRTVREWFADNSNAELLDEIVPLWPIIGSARRYAAECAQKARQTIVRHRHASSRDRRRAAHYGILPLYRSLVDADNTISRRSWAMGLEDLLMDIHALDQGVLPCERRYGVRRASASC